jgi:hypothetical protein
VGQHMSLQSIALSFAACVRSLFPPELTYGKNILVLPKGLYDSSIYFTTRLHIIRIYFKLTGIRYCSKHLIIRLPLAPSLSRAQISLWGKNYTCPEDLRKVNYACNTEILPIIVIKLCTPIRLYKL